MTEPEGSGDAPAGGPTPEEISARLEALLKRTHAMRAQQRASGAPQGMTWPPPDRELDHYDVVDVPRSPALQTTASAATASAATAATSRTAGAPGTTATPDAPTGGASARAEPSAPTAPREAPPSFARPDWGELRMRSMPDEPSGAPRWLVLLTVLLALATIGQAAYLWYLHQTERGPATGQLRVDGPEGAQIRIDGRAIGPAPIEHALAPGDYQVEIIHGTSQARAQRVTVGQGRTVVLLPIELDATAPTPPAADESPKTIAAESPESPTPAPTSAAAVPAVTDGDGVSPTLGAVVIESTPAGLPVTMEGRERGVTPIRIGRLKPGRHDVLVGGLARKIDVAANQVATLRVTRP